MDDLGHVTDYRRLLILGNIHIFNQIVSSSQSHGLESQRIFSESIYYGLALMCICTYIYTCTYHTHTHIYTYTYIHTHHTYLKILRALRNSGHLGFHCSFFLVVTVVTTDPSEGSYFTKGIWWRFMGIHPNHPSMDGFKGKSSLETIGKPLIFPYFL
jgi:hypothetical protein